MVLTNQLLNVGFSIIATFANSVEIPGQKAPQQLEDVKQYVIGSPYSPVDMYILDRTGREYWISDGVVCRFSSPGSLFQLQDPSLIQHFAGVPTLTSNEVANLAIGTLERLQRKDPNVSTPIVRAGGRYRDQELPFYEITWPSNDDASHTSTSCASMEIDARTGKIVFLHLWADAFRDPALTQRIMNDVYQPSLPKETNVTRRMNRPRLTVPPEPEVELAIRNGAIFATMVGIAPRKASDLEDINWEQTWAYTNKAVSTSSPVFQLRFADGTCFESLNGNVFGYFSHDACYTGFWDRRPPGEWESFKGVVTKSWKDLADDLETKLIKECGINKEAFTKFQPSTSLKPPDIGTVTVARIRVEWRNWPVNAGRTVWTSETSAALAAEFDLTTGALKWITFYDPELRSQIMQKQVEIATTRAIPQ